MNIGGLEALLAGRTLADRYRIEEVIGRGGMGAVYRATDERLGRAVAVKVITAAAGAEPDARERIRARFRHEAASAARLPHHPNVVPVYDYGTDPALGLDFLVMELLRGRDLASLLARSGPPPVPEGLRILQEAAQGVAVGHRSGLVHRDVKPGNIFLAEGEPGEPPEVRVLDFGIAKATTEEDTLSQLTQDGRAPLSPSFASPEQLRGLHRLTPASDVFSLGVVAYVLFTGQRPFTEPDRNRMSIGQAVPVPPLRSRNPDIPAAVDALVTSALAYDPQARFPDAAAFARAVAELRRSLGDTTVAMPSAYVPAGSDDRTMLFDAAPAAGAAGGAGLAAGAGIVGAGMTGAGADDRTMLDPGMHGGAGALPPLRPRSERVVAPPPEHLPAGVGAGPEKDDEFPAAPHRRGVGAKVAWGLVAVTLAGAGAAVWQGMQNDDRTIQLPATALPDSLAVVVDSAQADTADTLAAVVDTTSVVPPPPDPALEAQREASEGFRLFELGSFAEAAERYRRAVELDPSSAQYQNDYALALLRAGQVRQADTELQRTVERFPTRYTALVTLAEARVAQGDTASAVQYLERYLDQGTSEPSDRRSRAARRLRELLDAQEGIRADSTGQAVPPNGSRPGPR